MERLRNEIVLRDITQLNEKTFNGSPSSSLPQTLKILNSMCDFINSSDIEYLYVQDKNTFEYIQNLYGLQIQKKYGDFTEGEISALYALKKIYPELDVSPSLVKIFSSLEGALSILECKDNLEKDIVPYRYSIADNKVYEDVYMIDLRGAYPTYIMSNESFPKSLRLLFEQMIKIREDFPEMKRIQNSLTGMLKCKEFKYKNYELYYKIIEGVRNIIEKSRKILEDSGCVVLYSYTDSLHFIKPPTFQHERVLEEFENINKQFLCKWNFERVAKKVIYLQGFGNSCSYFYSPLIPKCVDDIVSKSSLNEKDFGTWSIQEIKKIILDKFLGNPINPQDIFYRLSEKIKSKEFKELLGVDRMDSGEYKIKQFNFPEVSQSVQVYRNIYGKYSVYSGDIPMDIDSAEIIRKFKEYVNKIIYPQKYFGYVQNSILEVDNCESLQVVFGHDDRNESFNVGVMQVVSLNTLENNINNFGKSYKIEEILFTHDR